MSIQPAGRSFEPAHRHIGEESSAAPEDALEFVRFCYRRRQVGWPALYDEMSVVAARGAFRGLGYGELAERGISFCLSDLPRLAALTEQVIAEQIRTTEPRPGTAAISMAPAPLRS